MKLDVWNGLCGSQIELQIAYQIFLYETEFKMLTV